MAPAAPAVHRRWRDSGALAAAVLVALVVVVYSPALQAGFVWDDDDYVTHNMTLRTVDGLRRIWLQPGAVPQYYPLVHTTFWLEYHLWGVRPLGYHAVNIALHALNVVLLWLVLRQLALPGAWLAAAIFAVHPVHVESVAWITERKNVLSGCFYLGAVLAYLRVCGVGRAAVTARGRHGAYLVALVLFACALLSKTVTGSLPAAMLLLLWWKRGRLHVGDVVPLIPLVTLAAGLGAVTIWMETHRVGATGADWNLSMIDRVLIAGRAVWFYAGTLAWPHRLTFVYPRWDIDSRVWWQYGFPLAAVAVVGGLYAARARVGRGPVVAALFFVGTLFPALGFIDVFPMRYTFVADHYQYLASIGVIVATVGVCDSVWRRRWPAEWMPAAGGVVLVTLGALAWRQAHAYRDLETLWRDTLAKNPGCWMAHNNLGLHVQEQGRLDEALQHYAAALRVKPDDAFAHANLATVLGAQGRTSEAMAHCEAALRIDPDYPEAHSNLGNVLASAGRLDAAIAHYRTAITLRPTYAEAHSNLANVLVMQGHIADAIPHYEEALRIDPDFATAHRNLGLVLAGQGRTAEAILHLEAATRLVPGDAEARRQLDLLRAAGPSAR
jgi:Flp pilus assembly protein TadD